ncbi:MAG: tail fiber domain-containing protein [Ferruginibacter sp.]
MITIYHIKKAFLFVTVLFLTVAVKAQKITNTELTKTIQPVNNSLEKLVKLNPSIFEYDTKKFKHLNLKQGMQYGFVAEEVQLVFPELVKEKSIPFMFGKNTYRDASIKTVDESSLIPVLVASVKELQLQVESLKTELEKIKSGKVVAVK